MTREFVMLPEFDKQWSLIGLDDDDLNVLQQELSDNPEKGRIIEGTGGLRKVRFAIEGKGKSGGARVCYVDFTVRETIYLITAYSKNEKDNLSDEERNNIRKLIKKLK